jgi:predicted double-glycine peptidase
VPYVSQSLLLCGGAAVAMVERWWGRRGVFAEEFAHLVRRDEGGIRTTDLAREAQSRGWSVQPARESAAAIQQSLADSVPVIALIRVGRRRYHYVVIVGWAGGRVTYHDPAIAPFASVDTAEFLQRWNGAQRWAVMVRPGAPPPSVAPAPRGVPAPHTFTDSLPCRPWLDQAADAAAAGDLDRAAQRLATAATTCANEPLVTRELAGVRFRQRRHAEAAQLALEYTTRVPGDSLGWQLLASSRYLAGDPSGALDGWNHVGRPVVDLIRIDALRRTRFRDVMQLSGIGPGSTLTAPRLALARRRLTDGPTLGAPRVTYTPVTGGVVELRVAANEKPLLDAVPQLLLNTSVDAIFRRDVHLSFAAPLRLGELWTVQWRWQPSDPRVALRVAIPARVGIPVVAQMEQAWETYRFSGALAEQGRNAATVQVTTWLHSSLEALAGVRLERWSALGDFAALRAGLGLHAADDRLTLLAEGDQAVPRGSGESYGQLRTRAVYAAPLDRWRTRWTMRLGVDVASAYTPIGVQPLAGGDLARAIPLRAHPFIVQGRLPASRIARTIAHGGIAGDRALTVRGPIRLGAGVFVDGARVGPNALGTRGSQLYLDAGAGLQIGLTGTQWAALRIDVARGLTVDRRWGFAAGLAPSLPLRLGRSR